MNTLDISLNTLPEGVCFDQENLTLFGLYNDELSAFRARKEWLSALEANFFLVNDVDVKFDLSPNKETGRFVLSCSFATACARYAFWRVTNYQAPEAQYIIETAHIPICESRKDEIYTAPDLKSIYETPSILSNKKGKDSIFKEIWSAMVDLKSKKFPK